MIFIIKDRPILSTIVLLVISLVVSGYFIAQMLIGDFGIKTVNKRQDDLQNLVGQYEKNESDLIHRRKRIDALNPESLDVDLLEEEMRKRMSYTKKNEVIIIRKW